MLVGVIADTHGLLRPQAVAALRGSERIIHAGDVGKPEILDALRALAPVIAVAGNIDPPGWLPEQALVELAGMRVCIIHDVKTLKPGGWDVVVSGHSHQPLVAKRGGILYVNPGSAGPRRFRLPVTVALLRIGEGEVQAGIVNLAL